MQPTLACAHKFSFCFRISSTLCLWIIERCSAKSRSVQWKIKICNTPFLQIKFRCSNFSSFSKFGINWRSLQIRSFTFFKVRTRKINPSGPTGDKRGEEIKRIFSLLTLLSLPLPHLLPFVFIQFLPFHSFFHSDFLLASFSFSASFSFLLFSLSLLSWRRPAQISSICLPLRKSFHRHLTNMKAMFVEGSCRCDLLRESKHCSYRKRVSVSECEWVPQIC